MNENDITITLTESQHELLNEILCHAMDSFHLATPYGMSELPLDNPIVQRYTMLENMKQMFDQLWVDRDTSITVTSDSHFPFNTPYNIKVINGTSFNATHFL